MKELFMIQSIPPHLAVSACKETDSLLLVVDMNAKKSSRMNSEVYRAIHNTLYTLCMEHHSADGQKPKANFKSNPSLFLNLFYLRHISGIFCNGQVNHLTWIQLSMHFTCWKNKQELKTSAVKALQSMSREETETSADVYGFQAVRPQRICNRVLKMTNQFIIMLVWLITN